MFKIHSLSTDKKYNLTLNVQLRLSYNVHSETKLKTCLQNAINKTSGESLKQCLQDKLNNNELLEVMRYYGMINKTVILECNKI